MLSVLFIDCPSGLNSKRIKPFWLKNTSRVTFPLLFVQGKFFLHWRCFFSIQRRDRRIVWDCWENTMIVSSFVASYNYLRVIRICIGYINELTSSCLSNLFLVSSQALLEPFKNKFDNIQEQTLEKHFLLVYNGDWALLPLRINAH